MCILQYFAKICFDTRCGGGGVPSGTKIITYKLQNFIFCRPCISIQLLVGDQLDAHFFYIVRSFQFSTCFELTRAHRQEVNCINTTYGIVTLCKWPSAMQVEKFLLDLHSGRPLTESDYTRCCINTIYLLTMNTCLFETCRGLK